MECLRFYDRANHHYAPASIHRDWALNNHRPRLNERAPFLSLSQGERRRHGQTSPRSILAIARFHFYIPRPVTTSPIIRPFGITNDVEKKPRRPLSLPFVRFPRSYLRLSICPFLSLPRRRFQSFLPLPLALCIFLPFPS